MFISHMLVENYRTFRHVELHFDSRVNYIVGDNNIGKSNFLTLLKFITHGYGSVSYTHLTLPTICSV